MKKTKTANNDMTKESLKEAIEAMIPKLLELAKVSCWNKLSDKLVYIISEIPTVGLPFNEATKIRNERNDKKIPMSFDEAIHQLLIHYENLYDINLYVYKATKNATIIDIRYFLKSSLDKEYQQTVKNNACMLHCKIALPPYQGGEKFDINWEHGW